MKICVQTNPMVPRYGVDKGFEIIKAAGFDGVDFNFDSYCTYNDMIECKIPISSQMRQKKKLLSKI